MHQILTLSCTQQGEKTPISGKTYVYIKCSKTMARKIKKYKVGLDSETYKISMVSEPAIEVDYVALEKQDEEVDIKLSSDERHICYGPALIPNKDIYRNNGEQEFYINFSEESISKMSQEFLKNYKQHEVNLQHEDNADEVFVCESWVVEDPYKDKANALGFNVPSGTWMIGMKVNNIEVWDKVKSGELKGFSVESAIRLEEFSKNDNNMIETNDEMFWNRLRNVISEFFSKKEEEAQKADIEPIAIEELAKETPAEPAPEPQPEPAPEPEPKVEEPKVEDAAKATQNPTDSEPKEEAPKETVDVKHLEDLINNLNEEIKSLKEMNGKLDDKVKELSKEPSAAPINVNAKPSATDTYSAWREQMRKML